jgi:S-DNA-T family DNA segregation ATPase FtsK/SpoIIIE
VPREPLRELEEQLTSAEENLERLKALRLPKLIRPSWIVLLTLFLAVAIILPTIYITRDWIFGSVVGTGAALVIGMGVFFGLHATASAQVARCCRPLTRTVAEGRLLKDHCIAQANRIYRRQVAGFQKQRQEEKKTLDETFRPKLEEMRKKRISELRRSSMHYQPQVAALQARYEFEQHRFEQEHADRRAAATSLYKDQLAKAEAAFEAGKTAIQRDQANAFQQMAAVWRAALATAKQRAETILAEAQRLFPSWEDLATRGPAKLDGIPSVLRIGTYLLDVALLPKGVPVDPQLKKESALRWELPALIRFPTPGNMLLRTTSAGERGDAVKVLQCVMLRYLTSLPAGKARLTVIDPVGLGENFAAFMHLADYDESLIAHRIWTEPAHIEHRLADITAHMESIIQKYLRNQYASIEAYNTAAGEVAEPFRVLVVAGFPVNFTTDAARRLVSIINSGARCGVVTLLSVDTKQDLPDGFHLKDIEPLCTGMSWQDEKPLWANEDFADLPLFLDEPPSAEFATAIITKVGAAAKDAKRVEVPFSFITPPVERWWKGDAGTRVDVPLGRVGATRRQALLLGQGTAQHVLIAGKTGSGKSTLLHVLVTSCALNYAPEEIELYLVDFKKGVEFKPYALHATPHVKVVAIESEREFGLSVLQRLDVELKRRGDRYRQLGAQDLAACRAADPDGRYPRILLIVDEFQEFFVEDDRLAQEAALVLDRLVRQGRAFGIHVILGSQTIGGAYTLARSTIDQMAVRIALPCSEADGHLILSEENAAARLLSRPGEAIYNDMSGLVEGNNPFQVAWLPDETREQLLDEVDSLSRARLGGQLNEPIVFEGNAPADLRKNPSLRAALDRRPTGVPKDVEVWIGEPIAIKEATSAVFRRQSGRHLAIIGQDEDAALGIFCSSLVSLAAQLPTSAKFHLFAAAPDAAEVQPLANLAAVLPHRPPLLGPRELPDVLAGWMAELSRRQTPEAQSAAPQFLFLYGIHRFRDLRKAEDDFGLTKPENMTPAQQFTYLLREGPALGLHMIAWADSLGGLLRSIDRQALRDVEMRVLFQMSGGDSSNLIDTPLASKLGMHRALFASEDVGKLEKFRPYGPPGAETLAWLRQHFAAAH